MQSIIFEYHPQSLPILQAAVLSAFEGGAPRVVLNLDALDRLDSDGVRGLIVLLRRARDIGGDLALQATRPEILRSLQVTALDRVFPMVATEVAA